MRVELTFCGPQDLVQETHDKLPRFFNLPADVKDRSNMINSPSFLGYTRLGAETTASRTDLREVSLKPSVLGVSLCVSLTLYAPAIRFWDTGNEALD